jgi:hypothetical protein
MCIGGWGDPSFANIKNIIAAQGNNTGNVIYRNLSALHGNLPIDAIDYDDESTYDSASAITFGQMAGSLGMKVSLCPYTNPSYWQAVQAGLGSYCDAVYLQCYDGGAGNDPAAWNTYFSGLKVMPGYWDYERDTTFLTKMQGWKSAGTVGGFYWPSCTGCTPPADPSGMLQYADWIHQAMVGPAYFAIVNQNSQKVLDVQWGASGNGVPIWQYAYNGSAAQLWSLVPVANNTHFAIVSALTGESVSIAGDSTASQAIIWDWAYNNDPSQQWDLVDVGNGLFNIRNVRSGLVLDVPGSSTADGVTNQQYAANGTGAQQFRLQPIGNYFIQAPVSGRYLYAQGGSTANGTQVVQYDWANSSSYIWNFANTTAGWYACNNQSSATPKAISVNAGSTTPGMYTQLWDYNNAPEQQCRIVPQTDGTFRFYFKHDGQSWDITGAGTSNNTVLDQYPDNGTLAQKFILQRIGP